jgi:hypothetical protein
MGLGSFSNHSDIPNTDLKLSKDKNYASFYALKDIKKGEEIFVNYGKSWWDKRKKEFQKL